MYIMYRLARGLEHYKNKHKKPQSRKKKRDKKNVEKISSTA